MNWVSGWLVLMNPIKTLQPPSVNWRFHSNNGVSGYHLQFTVFVAFRHMTYLSYCPEPLALLVVRPSRSSAHVLHQSTFTLDVPASVFYWYPRCSCMVHSANREWLESIIDSCYFTERNEKPWISGPSINFVRSEFQAREKLNSCSNTKPKKSTNSTQLVLPSTVQNMTIHRPGIMTRRCRKISG